MTMSRKSYNIRKKSGKKRADREKMAQMDLTQGNITKTLLKFAFPMICGNLLQQLYNVVDTLIVGQFLGADALAAVGSAYTLMTFLTSILLGLCMGSGAMFSIRYGEGNQKQLQEDMFVSFLLIAAVTVMINVGVFVFLDGIMRLLSVPQEVYGLMREYLWVIFWGIGGTFLYNYYASLLRAVGNSVVPLIFLGISAVINIVLDVLLILYTPLGVAGAGVATVIAQLLAGDYNFLLLDEPTNHLDLYARRALEGLLAQWQGTLLVITHDRALARGVGGRALWLEGGALGEAPEALG